VYGGVLDMENNKQLDQNKKEKPKSQFAKIAVIGFVGGLIWSLVAYFAFIFHFTEIGPNFFLSLFQVGGWKEAIIGQLVSILLLSLLSIGVAFLYQFFFKQFQGVLPGMVYGVAIWAILFLMLPLFTPIIRPVNELQVATITTSVCILILYGVFIAYSVSFEAMEQRRDESNYSNKS
jgi:Conserved membrane protein YqhR